jgi:5-bromo-4-chloroindolyl phosphate hydrolysis protein
VVSFGKFVGYVMSKAKAYKPNKNQKKLSVPKGILFYFFLVPLFISVVLALLQTDIKYFILNSISFILFSLTLHLSLKGFVQEEEYRKSILTKAPKIPYKTISGFFLGASTLFTIFLAGDGGFVKAIFLGVIATLGYYLYYGFDPREDKLDNLGDVSSTFVLETIEEAREKLDKVEAHNRSISDKTLVLKIDKAIKKAKEILKTIQEDPKDIRVARKFLIVYIDGVLQVVASYIAIKEENITVETQQRLYDLMIDLDTRFDKELLRLNNNNQFDLDVSIDVLKEQIKD